jgi:excisionase family DNA binding protein
LRTKNGAGSVHNERQDPSDIARCSLAPSRLLLRPEEAARLLAIGRSKLYELLASGELASVRIGRLRRVPQRAVEEFIEEMRAAG